MNSDTVVEWDVWRIGDETITNELQNVFDNFSCLRIEQRHAGLSILERTIVLE